MQLVPNGSFHLSEESEASLSLVTLSNSEMVSQMTFNVYGQTEKCVDNSQKHAYLNSKVTNSVSIPNLTELKGEEEKPALISARGGEKDDGVDLLSQLRSGAISERQFDELVAS